jgi:hypothetical protein
VRSPMMVLAAVTLNVSVATTALAAGPIGGGVGHSGASPGGPRTGGFVPPAVESVPAMPGPTFNPSQTYTVPQSPEVPVSPGSPGSVFGNR